MLHSVSYILSRTTYGIVFAFYSILYNKYYILCFFEARIKCCDAYVSFDMLYLQYCRLQINYHILNVTYGIHILCVMLKYDIYICIYCNMYYIIFYCLHIEYHIIHYLLCIRCREMMYYVLQKMNYISYYMFYSTCYICLVLYIKYFSLYWLKYESIRCVIYFVI